MVGGWVQGTTPHPPGVSLTGDCRFLVPAQSARKFLGNAVLILGAPPPGSHSLGGETPSVLTKKPASNTTATRVRGPTEQVWAGACSAGGGARGEARARHRLRVGGREAAAEGSGDPAEARCGNVTCLCFANRRLFLHWVFNN